MALNIKLLRWGDLFSKSEASDKSVAILTDGSPDSADRADFIEAMMLTDNDINTNTTLVTATTHAAGISDTYILADDDTAGAAITITLPAAATIGEGGKINVKKLGVTGNVIIDGNASELIDGATTATLTTQYEAVTLVCNGTTWYIF